jgi:polyisoprenoid-binding protein YceI
VAFRTALASFTMADMTESTITTTTTSTLPLKPGTWSFDEAHGRAGFAIRHLGVSKVRGFFADVDAELLVGASLADCSVSATVDVASLDTGNRDRDAHVLSDELLDVARRPTMTFRSTSIRAEGEDWKLDGDLTIGDVTQPITLDVEFGGVAEFAVDGTRHAGFEARGELRRKDFGIDFGAVDSLLGQKVAIELDLEFIEPS